MTLAALDHHYDGLEKSYAVVAAPELARWWCPMATPAARFIAGSISKRATRVTS